MINARENKLLLVAPPTTDLLVCFPSRAHLTLMPKPIYSPARPSGPTKRHNHLKRINSRATNATPGGPNSPLMWAKPNQMRPEINEPTSPKVTCVGQIKVGPNSSSACRDWQSVMEEIERIHKSEKNNKKSSKLVGIFGFKKDVMNFVTCLRNIKFDFRCFGAYSQPIITSDDEEFEDNVSDNTEKGKHTLTANANNNDAVISKWFMVLQDDTNNHRKENEGCAPPSVPPPNALLLMRCRSAPTKSWVEEKEDEDSNEKNEEENEGKKKHWKRKSLGYLMKYDVEFYDF